MEAHAMNIFASPAPQWQDVGTIIGGSAFKLVPVLDATGFWTFLEGETAEGRVTLDASGFLVIDDTTITQDKRLTKLPNGNILFA